MAVPTAALAASRQMLANTWVLAPLLGDSPHPPLVSVSTRERLIALRILNGHSHRVAKRPDRVEPRAVKRHPTPLALLTEFRVTARARLLAGQKMGSPPFVLTGGRDTPLVVNQFHNTRINTFGGEPENVTTRHRSTRSSITESGRDEPRVTTVSLAESPAPSHSSVRWPGPPSEDASTGAQHSMFLAQQRSPTAETEATDGRALAGSRRPP